MYNRDRNRSICLIYFTYKGERRVLAYADNHKEAMIYRRLCYEALRNRFEVDFRVTNLIRFYGFHQHEIQISDELIELLEGAYGCVFIPPST